MAIPEKELATPIILIGTRDQGQGTGISKMFELFVANLAKENYPHFVIDLTLGIPTKVAGSFNLKRAIRLVGAIIKYYSLINKAKSIYLTIGVSRLGFFRDALILWPAFIFRKNTTIHVHSGGYGDFYKSQPPYIKIIIKKTIERIDKIIVLGNLLVEQFNFVPNYLSKIHVIKNGLPIGLSPDINSHRKLSASKYFRVLFLSNLIESKGFLDVLEACRILNYEKDISVQVDFCGNFRSSVNDIKKPEVDTTAKFDAYVMNLGIEKYVNFHGIVSGIKKENLLRNADLLVLPTYYPTEGQPTCIIEALAYGIPVVATKYRGIPEEIIENYNGFFVDPKSPIQIANRIEWFLKHPQEYEEFSKNALKLYTENFTSDVYFKNLVSVLLEN